MGCRPERCLRWHYHEDLPALLRSGQKRSTQHLVACQFHKLPTKTRLGEHRASLAKLQSLANLLYLLLDNHIGPCALLAAQLAPALLFDRDLWITPPLEWGLTSRYRLPSTSRQDGTCKYHHIPFCVEAYLRLDVQEGIRAGR